jgi:ER degradation enhancer, mannosidase alpha-like 2
MKTNIRYTVCSLLFCLILIPILTRAQTAADVKAEFLHAWNGYVAGAWGHDALKPLSHTPHDWYGVSLCMTPVDAYDGMLLMGLTDEAAKTKCLILDSLSFNRNIEVQFFEVNIRLLGGLLSAYQLDSDPKFLALAEDLGKRLLPVFHSPTGMPYRFINLVTGKTRDSLNNPAEIGTALLEFGVLSRLTGDSSYYHAAKVAVRQLYARRSAIGLVGTMINIETGAWVDSTSHIGGMIDSYYEYLIKAWLLFGDTECKAMWDEHCAAINHYVADTVRSELWYGQVNFVTGRRTGTRFGSLEAFFPAVLCLAGDSARARQLEASCLKMWNLYGIEPEELDYSTMTPTAKQYYLRPEIIESAYYLRHFTGDPVYAEMGKTFFTGIRRRCRTEHAYAMLADVTTGRQQDRMESFFFAETLKYLYLLLAPESALAFDQVVFNTEAHPLQATWKR